MRFIYADPPYFGCAVRHYGEQAAPYDEIPAHQELVDSFAEFDGWALSMSSNNLLDLVPLLVLPEGTRVGGWFKPFVFYRPGLSNAYAWEPVLFKPLRTKGAVTTPDWCMVNTTFKRGLAGAKPLAFCLWLLDLVGARSSDEFVDRFPGTGVFGKAVELWRQRLPLKIPRMRRGRRYHREIGPGAILPASVPERS